MKKNPVFQYLFIDYYSATPKYLQLANSIIKAIGDGKIQNAEVMPSINELSFEFEISRDTAEKGYKYLKKMGILDSIPGKGYFVKNTAVKKQLKIFLLFNKLSPHKKIIYDAFVAHIGEFALIDLYIYNNDIDFFKRLIQDKKNDYTHYVIIPHFIDKSGSDTVHEIINTIQKKN
jgi:DNA-binding transcriptional regulator YhcF (GntR family)